MVSPVVDTLFHVSVLACYWVFGSTRNKTALVWKIFPPLVNCQSFGTPQFCFCCCLCLSSDSWEKKICFFFFPVITTSRQRNGDDNLFSLRANQDLIKYAAITGCIVEWINTFKDSKWGPANKQIKLIKSLKKERQTTVPFCWSQCVQSKHTLACLARCAEHGWIEICDLQQHFHMS